MAEIVKVGHYNPDHLAEVAFHFGRTGKDGPVLALLGQGTDPNAADRFGMTALHRGAQFDRQVVVRALLDAGVDPNRTTKWGATPLMGAVSGDVARLLLEAAADVNAVTVPNRRGLRVGRTALMQAAERGNGEVAAVLLEYGADTQRRDEAGCTALMLAVWSEKHEVVRLLLDAGVSVGLVEAALLGNQAQVRTLLATGADLNRHEMANALRWAAIGGHVAVVALLLENGAPLDAADAHGNTALMQAAAHGKTEVMRLLLERGVDPLAVSQQGGTALAACVQSSTRRNSAAVELLLTYGAQADVRSRSGWTPLMLACLWGDMEVAEILLRNGADPNAFTDAEIMEREEGCSNTNALMLAVGNGHIEIVKLLLQYGADSLAANSVGMATLDVARRGLRCGYKLAEIQHILPLLDEATSGT